MADQPTLADAQYGALAGKPKRITDGSATAISAKPAILHRMIVGAAPAADRTVSIRNGGVGAAVVTAILVRSANPDPWVELGILCPDGLSVTFDGAVDVTLVWS